ncbi:MAG: putative ABC transporter permease [Clostridia bacterium]|nr:putative ABC transporter permease [Clostridia bacterium]
MKETKHRQENSNIEALTVSNTNKIISIKRFDKFDEEERKVTFENVVFVFFICAVIGFLVETIFIFLMHGKFVNRGMTYGPYCTIYGVGGLILYLFFHDIKPIKKNIPYTFISTAIVMGTFELVSGLILKHLLGIEMWNYDTEFLPILHYTSVPVMIGWGILATMYVYFIQPLLLKFISLFPKHIMKKLAVILLFIYTIDLGLSTVNIYTNPEVLYKLVNPSI